MLKNRPIGVFDSGLGGLTAVKELKKILPNENIIYFGDTGRVPYGNRSNATIIHYANQDASFLLSHDVKLIIAACGTVSSVATNLKDDLSVPFVEVVTPTSQKAVEVTKNGKIGVIGTKATINSHSYRECILQQNSGLQVFENACPLFVPLVESGWISRDDKVTIETAKRYLEPLMEKGIDTLILGCTHYPIIRDVIADIVGDGVTLINSGEQAAIKGAEILKRNDLLSDEKQPNFKYFVSDSPETFGEIATLFLGENTAAKAEKINITKFGRK